MSIAYLKLWKPVNQGATDHTITTKTTLIDGEKKNITKFLEKGLSNWLENNFVASAIGCKMPLMETLLGPTRNWL